jgi:hypothetical protein
MKRDEAVTDNESNPLDYYNEARPLLRHVRVMNRFFDEVVAEPPYRQFQIDLYDAFLKILNEELAPHALTLAIAITELEDAFPEIGNVRDES